jgi:hypothetical protein
MIIKIDQTMKRECRRLAERRRELCRAQNQNPLFQSNPLLNEMTGIMGEMIFDLYLTKKGVEHECSYREYIPGKFDFKDCVVFGKIIDVKTANLPFNTNKKFFIPIQQAKQNVDWYVAVLLDEEWENAKVIGFMEANKAYTYPQKVGPINKLNFEIPYKDFEDILTL